MALSPMPRNVVTEQQFSPVHQIPNHPLFHHSDHREYTCHACNTAGFGAQLQCQACPVSIHVYCSDFPSQLSCFFHTHHPLFQVPLSHPGRICDLCREPINGLSYRCDGCDFDIHPLCTQFPREISHVIDSNHKLQLRKAPSGNCGVCGNDCSSNWVYGCGVCRVNVHIHCLRRQYDSGGSRSRSRSGGSVRTIPNAPSWWMMEQQQHGFFHEPPVQLPNFHFWYPGPASSPVYFPFPPPPPQSGSVSYYHNQSPPPGSVSYYHNQPPPPPPGSVSYNHNQPPPPPQPSGWGTSFLDSVFSLLGNVAVGAINGFLFGSVEF